MKNLKNRRGSFKVSKDMIDKYPGVVMKMMGHMIIFRAEYMYMYQRFEYFAISPWFDELNEGDSAPEYTVETNGIDFMFQKC